MLATQRPIFTPRSKIPPIESEVEVQTSLRKKLRLGGFWRVKAFSHALKSISSCIN